jgi:hypothetical protein
MKKTMITKRKALKNKMAEALHSNITTLSSEMKDILLDDLITAFQNRLKVLNQSPLNVQFLADNEIQVSQLGVQK